MVGTREETSLRRRVNLPKVDTSVSEWWAMQYDPSLSVRLLIRGDIERNGYRDVAHGPVKRLPRPGRPVAGSGVEQLGDVTDEDSAVDPHPVDDEPRELVSVGASENSTESSEESPGIASLMGM